MCIGYPEACTVEPGTNYNSQVIVSPVGAVVTHYRKSFLYYTDETWAAEGQGFAAAVIPAFGIFETVVTGICMDINPYKFQAAEDAYEFATYGIQAGARLIVLSTAWLTRLSPAELLDSSGDEDIDTISYWINRFTPLVENESGTEEIVVVFANRCGLEPGTIVSADLVPPTLFNGQPVVGYAGSSCAMRFANGTIDIWDMLGRAEETVLLIDTEAPPRYSVKRSPWVR